MLSWQADDPLPRLEVSPLSEHDFESTFESHEGRTFGGEILAKAVMAAAHVGGDRTFHSLHAYFLRAARPEEEVRFHVHRLRHGRRLASYRVAVRQAGREIAEVSTSFTAVDD